MVQGKVAAKTIAAAVAGIKIEGPAPKFKGLDFPTFFKQANGSTEVDVNLPQNDEARCSFLTDVKNNYFTRAKHKGNCELVGDIQPTFRLFNGRLTFTFDAERYRRPIGSTFKAVATISDPAAVEADYERESCGATRETGTREARTKASDDRCGP